MANRLAAATGCDDDVIRQQDLVFLEEEVDANWEFVNASDADSDTESLLSVENGFLAWCSSQRNQQQTQIERTHEQEEEPEEEQSPVDDCPLGPCLWNRVHPLPRSVMEGFFFGSYEGQEEEEEEDEDEDEEDGCELDDELVPWNVSGKLGRGRMRKQGKRGFARMVNSKRNPHRFVKAGCVRGKHGLVIKA